MKLLDLQKLRTPPLLALANDDAYVWLLIWLLVYGEIQHEMLVPLWKQVQTLGWLGYSWPGSRLASRVTFAPYLRL